MLRRKKTKKIFVGNVPVGAGSYISVQSMTNTDTRDVKKTITQINRLHKTGCDIVRVAIPDNDAADAFKEIVKRSPIPVIADIHYDYALAIKSIRNGAHCIRINPGNIKNPKKITAIINAAREYDIPIRIGVNSGSLDIESKKKYPHGSPSALVHSALNFVKLFEDNGFDKIKISLKSTDALTTIKAYEEFSAVSDYPLHVGITEAGTEMAGTVRSSLGIGYLLLRGIGDTIRVSLTANPEKEVIVGREILKSIDLRSFGPTLISCPTCARKEIDVIHLAGKIEKQLITMKSPIKVAVMGCPVNGPGEAMEADIGIAGSKNSGIIFKKGKVIKRVAGLNAMLNEFLIELRKMDEDFQRRLS
jgi:(E)-4-hydroxy-3-methylbut-2-enyl-diphosphate synthase